MKKIWLSGLAVLIGTAVFAKVLDFNERGFLAAVRKTKGIAMIEKNELQIFSIKPKKSGTAALYPLPELQKNIAGKTVTISAEIALDNLSKPLAPWAGPKLLLEVRREQNFSYYSFYSPKQQYGKMDWTKSSKTIKMPDDAQFARLVLGMQGQKGTVLFRNINIEIK